MKVSQRQVVIALLSILTVGTLFALIYQIFRPNSNFSLISTGVGLLILTSLLIAYRQGWSPARYIALIFITLLIGMTTDGAYLTEKFTLSAILPPIFAMIVAGPIWIAGSALSVLTMLIIRAGGQGIYVEPLADLIYLMTVSGILLARMITTSAQLDAEENARQTRQALIKSEAQAYELSQKAKELELQNKQQRQLLDLVTTLETPAVSLAEGVLLAPVVGHLDSRRATDLTKRLLHEVNVQHTRLVILDIAGVPTVDTAVAQALLRTIQAVRLLGCEVTITGISASVATTMTQLGINMAGVRTARTPQEVMGDKLTLSPNLNHN